jgi:hypothetical protein
MINPKNWNIYAARLPSQAITYSSIATIIPTVVGATGLLQDKRESLRAEGCVFDDEGKNISLLNPFFCELTSIYWMLNNVTHDYVGNAHYRRKWSDKGLSDSCENALYIASEQRFPLSLRDQFLAAHPCFDAPSITIDLAERGKLPFTPTEMSGIWDQSVFHGYQMARGPLREYKAFMSLALECLWPIWDEHAETIKALDPYNRRMIGFIGERMMTGLFLCRNRFFDFPIATSEVELKT